MSHAWTLLIMLAIAMHTYELYSVSIVIASALCFIQLLMQTFSAKF